MHESGFLLEVLKEIEQLVAGHDIIITMHKLYYNIYFCLNLEITLNIKDCALKSDMFEFEMTDSRTTDMQPIITKSADLL